MAFDALPNIFALTPLDPKFRENPHGCSTTFGHAVQSIERRRPARSF